MSRKQVKERLGQKALSPLKLSKWEKEWRDEMIAEAKKDQASLKTQKKAPLKLKRSKREEVLRRIVEANPDAFYDKQYLGQPPGTKFEDFLHTPKRRYGKKDKYLFPHGFTPQKTPGGVDWTPRRMDNLDRLDEGLAPIGTRNESLGPPTLRSANVHHLTQNDNGLKILINAPFHKQETGILHNTEKKADIDRSGFLLQKKETLPEFAKMMAWRVDQQTNLPELKWDDVYIPDTSPIKKKPDTQ